MACESGDLTTRFGSTIVAERSFHVLKIEGYSRALNISQISDRPSFNSRPFRAGGRTWYTSFRPRGSPDRPENTDSISFFIHLVDTAGDEAVTAAATFTLLDPDGVPVHTYTKTTKTKTLGEPGKDRFTGFERFMKRQDLERSDCVKDDCFTIRIHVHIVKEAPSVVVPPPDIHRHIGSLLWSKEQGTDVEFRVGGEAFAAHRVLLGARSPVFRAELFGLMKEGTATNVVRIDDMEPQVFSALLTFVYTDTWPDIDEEDECAMTQHLLAAADRYQLQRLKLMCEDRLLSHIGARSAATILALSEQHRCGGLKKACFDFLSSKDSLEAAIETEDFEHLARSCPAMVMGMFSCLLKGTKFDELCCSDPPSATVSVKAHHVLKIDGFSRSCEALCDGKFIDSCPFRAGGYTWLISIVPMASRPEYRDAISIFLVLVDATTDDEMVMSQATFSLLDQDQKPVQAYSYTTRMVNLSELGSIGSYGFIRRDDLVRSGHLKDDCFAVKTDIHIVVKKLPSGHSKKEKLPPPMAVVPPPDIHKHLGDLLSSKEGTDVEFRVAGETFGAHRLMLVGPVAGFLGTALCL